MTTYIRIEKGVVFETFECDGDIYKIHSREHEWVVAPPGCAQGWLKHNGEIVAPDDYRVLRAKEYPSITDQLDAIWKIVAALHGKSPVPDDALLLLSAVEKVKTDRPKPVG